MSRFNLRSAALLATACVLGLLFGVIVPILPLKATAVLLLIVVGLVGLTVAILMPDKEHTPYGVIYAIFLLAIVSKFVWPNFAYLPIPGLPSKNPQRWIWALCVAYWAYSMLVSGSLRDRLAYRLGASGLAKLLCLLLLWRFASIFASDEPATSAYTLLVETFDHFMAFMFCLTWIRGERDVERIGLALVITTAMISSFAVAEIALRQNIFIKLVPYDPTNEMFLTMAVESKLREGGYRAQASFNHPLLMAQFVVTVLPIIVYALFKQGGKWVKAVSLFSLTSVPFLLWASRTRTAVLVAGVVLTVGFIMLATNAARRKEASSAGSLLGGVGLVFAAGLTCAVGVAAFVLTVGRTAEESVSSMARAQMLRMAFRAATTEPLLGFGPALGNVQAAIYSSRGSASLDNYWLTLLLESGFPAMILFVIALALVLRGIVKQTMRGHATEAHLLSATWGLAALAFGITTTILSTTHNLPLLNLCFGVLVALAYPGADSTKRALPGSSVPQEAFPRAERLPHRTSVRSRETR
jgi:hypothetical protein